MATVEGVNARPVAVSDIFGWIRASPAGRADLRIAPSGAVTRRNEAPQNPADARSSIGLAAQPPGGRRLVRRVGDDGHIPCVQVP